MAFSSSDSESQVTRDNKSNVVVSTSIAFAAGDTLTTEKKTDSITLSKRSTSGFYKISIYKPTEDTAGDMTLKIYNVESVDGTNSRDHLHATITVEKISGADTNSTVVVLGLGGTIKLGALFAADSGAITTYISIEAI